jgi:hypothetical protein
MKIRTGFVSNSSSSSFMLVAKSNELNEVLNSCHEHIKHLFPSVKKHVIDGIEFSTVLEHESSEETSYYMDDYVGEVINNDEEVVGKIAEDLDDFGISDIVMETECIYLPGNAVSLVVDKMEKKKYNCIYNSISC